MLNIGKLGMFYDSKYIVTDWKRSSNNDFRCTEIECVVCQIEE